MIINTNEINNLSDSDIKEVINSLTNELKDRENERIVEKIEALFEVISNLKDEHHSPIKITDNKGNYVYLDAIKTIRDEKTNFHLTL